MSGFRVAPREAFAKVRNGAARDPNLSYKAKGVLATILSFDDEWVVQIPHLVKLATNREHSVRSAFNELIAAGYVVRRERLRQERGRFAHWQYDVYDTPHGEPPRTLITPTPPGEGSDAPAGDDATFHLVTDNRFVMVRNAALRDPSISYKAKGLLVTMLSFPPGSAFNLALLTRFATDEKDSVATGINDLERAGYVVFQGQRRKPNGTYANSAYLVADYRIGSDEDPTRKSARSDAANTPATEQPPTRTPANAAPPARPTANATHRSAPRQRPREAVDDQAATPRAVATRHDARRLVPEVAKRLQAVLGDLLAEDPRRRAAWSALDPQAQTAAYRRAQARKADPAERRAFATLLKEELDEAAGLLTQTQASEPTTPSSLEGREAAQPSVGVDGSVAPAGDDDRTRLDPRVHAALGARLLAELYREDPRRRRAWQALPLEAQRQALRAAQAAMSEAGNTRAFRTVLKAQLDEAARLTTTAATAGSGAKGVDPVEAARARNEALRAATRDSEAAFDAALEAGLGEEEAGRRAAAAYQATLARLSKLPPRPEAQPHDGTLAAREDRDEDTRPSSGHAQSSTGPEGGPGGEGVDLLEALIARAAGEQPRRAATDSPPRGSERQGGGSGLAPAGWTPSADPRAVSVDATLPGQDVERGDAHGPVLAARASDPAPPVAPRDGPGLHGRVTGALGVNLHRLYAQDPRRREAWDALPRTEQLEALERAQRASRDGSSTDLVGAVATELDRAAGLGGEEHARAKPRAAARRRSALRRRRIAARGARTSTPRWIDRAARRGAAMTRPASGGR